jgi:hypothetical protein
VAKFKFVVDFTFEAKDKKDAYLLLGSLLLARAAGRPEDKLVVPPDEMSLEEIELAQSEAG